MRSLWPCKVQGPFRKNRNELQQNLSLSIVQVFCICNSKSDGFRLTPHELHLPLKGLSTSLIDLIFMILLILLPHFSQVISIDGNDISSSLCS